LAGTPTLLNNPTTHETNEKEPPMPETGTTQAHKIEFVSEFFCEFSETGSYRMWFEIHDVGFPLAYAIHNKIVPATAEALELVMEAWKVLLFLTGTNGHAEGEDADDDIGWETYTDMDFPLETDA
jgi:hypothetical protein